MGTAYQPNSITAFRDSGESRRLDHAFTFQPIDAAVYFRFLITRLQLRRKPEKIDGQMRQIHRDQLFPSGKHFAQKQKQAAARRIKPAIQLQVEPQMSRRRSDHFQKQRVPDDPPDSHRLAIRRQTVAEEPKADLAMFATQRVVETVV